MKRKNGVEGKSVKKEMKKGRANVYKTMDAYLGRQLKEAEAVLTEENANVPIDWSPHCGQEPPKENFPEVVLLDALGVRKCQGCKGKILRMKCPPSKKLVFHM